MNCAEFERFADAYLDGEFDTYELAEVDAHLNVCDACRSAAETQSAFRQVIREHGDANSAPPHLQAAVRSALERANHRRLHWVPMAGASLVVAIVFFMRVSASPPSDLRYENSIDAFAAPIVEASVDWHRQNLPIEVTGPDAEVIRDWFSDKVDFPVRLPHFDEQLQPNVLGARLSHLSDRRAAHVLYEIQGNKVSVMLFEGSNLGLPQAASSIGGAFRDQAQEIYVGNRNGYNVAIFTDNGVTYTITTEIPQPDFAHLVDNVLSDP